MAQPQHDQLSTLLKDHFGFDEFRPLQREIVTDVLAGRDVFALLPTGGGKSLCFQLTAVAREGLTLVVSPLIALMKDQVDSMTAMGIPATFLNSSISASEAASRLRGLRDGKFKLLYAAPERLMQGQFLTDLQAWKPRLIAIDEAHCISEWGHDFRPEYRQLARLRQWFPNVPLLALTATATNRVRADIVRQLDLKNPGIYIASFNRPNLTYTVRDKSDATTQTVRFVKARGGESGIVYCQSRKSTESIAADLTDAGISAQAYHAGMEPGDRARAQESFLRDETQVICATIAFGMGINKPNVRFVIHYDMPKNVEGYYQETGRAGRDSLPSDCLLLYSPGDVVKLMRFLDDKPEPERTVARQQLDQMMHFAESGECRRRAVLRYFSETYPEENCGSCDNCLNPKVRFDGTLAAQKFLSCVYRVREKSGFGLGLAHYAEILTGADTEKVRRFGHETLSTYGIGKEHSRPNWMAIGRELVRLGYLRQDSEKFNAVELTAAGRDALSKRTPVMLSTRPQAEKTRAASDGAFDEELFAQLRAWRKNLADERNVPAYIVLSDVTLRQVARDYPGRIEDLGRISGIGRAKLQDLGESLLAEVAAFLRDHPRKPFPATEPVEARTARAPGSSARGTVRAYRQGESIPAIAATRGLSERTVISHLVEAIAAGEDLDVDLLVSPAARQEISRAFAEFGDSALAPIKEHFQDKFSYDQLQLARACYRAPSARANASG
jgi:ATP-dependent DNA helicase RecQ